MKNLIARMIGLDEDMRHLEYRLRKAEHANFYNKQQFMMQKAVTEFYRKEQAEARTHLVNAKQLINIDTSGSSAARAQIDKAMDRLRDPGKGDRV